MTMQAAGFRVGLLATSLFLCAPLLAAEPDGHAILTTFVERHQVPFESEHLTVTLTDADGNQIVREMRRYSRKQDDGMYRHLAVYDAPSSIAGTALLTWQQEGKPDHHWTYLPAFGKVRKQGVTPGSSRKYFMGTDLTYEDIATEDTNKYSYERMEDQVIDGIDLFVVRATSATPEMQQESGYGHRDLYLRKDNFVLVRADYYDTRDKFIKRLTAVSEPVNIAGDAWRVDQVAIENEREKHRTEMHVTQRVLGEDEVPQRMFSPNFLTNKRHIK